MYTCICLHACMRYVHFTKADTGLSLQLVNYLTSYDSGIKKGGLTDLQTRLEHYTCPRPVSQSVCWVFCEKPKDGMGGRTDKPASDFFPSSSWSLSCNTAAENETACRSSSLAGSVKRIMLVIVAHSSHLRIIKGLRKICCFPTFLFPHRVATLTESTILKIPFCRSIQWM